MTQDKLIQKIEQLAVEFVLIDHDDTEELNSIILILNDILKWASDNSKETLREALLETIKLAEKIVNQSADSPEKSMEIIGSTISEIQRHARNNFEFHKANYPEELGLSKASKISEPAEHKKGTKDQKEDDVRPVYQKGLRHPSCLPGHLDNELFAEFLALQPDILDKIEALILSIEQQEDEESVTELKRMIHTTKGEAGFLNLNDVENLCHITEDALEITTPSKHADIFLSVIDWIRNAFNWYGGGSSTMPDPVEKIVEKIELLKNQSAPLEKPEEQESMDFESMVKEISGRIGTTPTTIDKTAETFYLKFVSIASTLFDSSADIIPEFLNSPSNRKLNLKLQKIICKLNAASNLLSLIEIDLLSEETHRLLDRMAEKKELQETSIAEIVFESFDKLLQLKNTIEASIKDQAPVLKDKDLPELIARVRVALYGNFVESLPRPAPVPLERVSGKEVNEQSYDMAYAQIKEPSLPKPSPSSAQLRETINVDAERLDKIIDMIGELIIAESMVMQAEEIKKIESQDLNRHLHQMDKITRGLQETGLSLRMLPIKSTFQKMGRLARDTAKKSGKKVKFLMYGEDTELDKTVVDKIGDPLLHMVRNSIDHGIEDKVLDRTKAGKSEHGTIIMRAFHKGGNINIEIEDDGRGLNKKSIIAKAVERNIISKGSTLTDREIFNLIFEQGFSTSSEITDISGRGVGMNVVKTSIEALHGQVDIKSREGKGCIFTIKIPLTLAIIDGMVVKVGTERFIIPTLSIITSSKLDKNHITSIFKKGEIIEVQDKIVPLFKLSKLFKTDLLENNIDYSLIVVVEEDNRQAALIVDELIGKQQIVIKNLGESMQNIPGISGGAIMPDGIVGLIIDVGDIVRLAHEKSS